MKIKSVCSYLYPNPKGKQLLLVKVETEEGYFGWGEGYTIKGKEAIAQHYVELMAVKIVGRNPFDIKHLLRTVFDDFCIRRSTLDISCALSGIEIALWDLVGKACRQPIYNLLGGKCRGSVEVYANGWGDHLESPDETAKAAVEVVSRGFKAIKWDPFNGPWRTFISREEEDLAVENVRAVRSAVGPEIELLIDAHRRLTPNRIIDIAKRFEKYRVLQLEDPCLADNLSLVAQVKSAVGCPIVTGETLFTKEQFSSVFSQNAADIVNPDVCVVGGILSMLEIASMAEPYAVGISPHNNNSTTIGLAATLNVSLLVSNFVIAEHFINLEDVSGTFTRQGPNVENGMAKLTDLPGLGIDIDEAEVAAASTRSQPESNRSFLSPEQEGH